MLSDKKTYVFRSFWDRDESHRALKDALQRSKRRHGRRSRSNSPMTPSGAGAADGQGSAVSVLGVLRALSSESETKPTDNSKGGVEMRTSETTKSQTGFDDEVEESGEKCAVIRHMRIHNSYVIALTDLTMLTGYVMQIWYTATIFLLALPHRTNSAVFQAIWIWHSATRWPTASSRSA